MVLEKQPGHCTKDRRTACSVGATRERDKRPLEKGMGSKGCGGMSYVIPYTVGLRRQKGLLVKALEVLTGKKVTAVLRRK